ncbi:LPS translocon maturation chaperone LptM [Corallococcus macrosporus]|uniref:Lipoprotein n=1 Tax=Myxococcus fulvus (strain ATCC BAA-855 / HW-1) TaxID=483219 RepID=F8CLA2_MYXFH|nr:lipoprotein [Corallococcus macrosporus]AEI65227.1 hypothetical protein LILAB_16620 [Corallococcus macrosporus]
MRHVLAPLLVAASLTLTLAACGIKGPPRPPSAPATQTQPPPPESERGPLDPSGPTLTPTPGTGVETPLSPPESTDAGVL